MRYTSKRDPQLVGLLHRASLGFGGGAALLAFVAWRVDSELLGVLALVLLLFAIASQWTLRETWYEVTALRLRIRCGPSRMAISWENVVRVLPTQDRRNAPALSFDRLQVDYRQGKRWRSVLISPIHQEQFIEELCQVAGLTAEGKTCVRSGASPESVSPTSTP